MILAKVMKSLNIIWSSVCAVCLFLYKAVMSIFDYVKSHNLRTVAFIHNIYQAVYNAT